MMHSEPDRQLRLLYQALTDHFYPIIYCSLLGREHSDKLLPICSYFASLTQACENVDPRTVDLDPITAR